MWVVQHGGYANAYTGHEHTNYHFDVNASHLEEALDRSELSTCMINSWVIACFFPSLFDTKPIKDVAVLSKLDRVKSFLFSPKLQSSATWYGYYRFAQFFISPLLSSEATSREIHAVDSGIELDPWISVYFQFSYLNWVSVSPLHELFSFWHCKHYCALKMKLCRFTE